VVEEKQDRVLMSWLAQVQMGKLLHQWLS